MKLPLSQTIIFKLSLSRAPIPGTNPLTYAAAHGPNYLVYDDHRDAPPGFAVRVGKKASIYLVDKLVARKKLKIPVGLAAGKKGNDKPISLTDARIKAWDSIKVAITHGANPKDIAVQIEASELAFGVRPRGRAICRVKFPAGVGHSSVAEGNCVVVRRGGE